MSEDGWLRTHASLVIRKAPEMSASVRVSVARWLREQAVFIETRADEMGEFYCPRFMDGDEEPYQDRAAHLRVAREHENAQRRASNRIQKRTRPSE